MQISYLKKIFTLQHGQTDCGIACLSSIIKFYGGYCSIENLRQFSGTSISGTTLLGLFQAAQKSGFNAEGCEATIEALFGHESPCILHVVLENNLKHYLVYFGVIKQNNEIKCLIGDPAKGIIFLDRIELEKIWISKTCLTLLPNENFKRVKQIKQEKHKWIIEHIKTDAPFLTIAAALGIAITALGLAMAIFSQKLIDEIIPKHEFTKLNVGIVLLLVILLIKEGISILRQFFLLRQSKDFNIRIIDFFYTHLLQLPKSFFDTRKIGELTARLSDTARIQRVISQLAGNAIIDALMVVVSTGFVFVYSWKVGIACLIATPVFYLLICKHKIKIIEGQQRIMASYAQTESNYISTLQGIEPIKNYNKQSIFSTTNHSFYQTYQTNIFFLGKVQIKLSFWANCFAVIFLIIVLSFTSYQVLHNQLKTGELIAIMSLCGTLLPSIANLALLTIPINEAKIAFDRMFEFTSIKTEQKIEGAIINSFASLHLQDVSFRFAGRSLLLKNIYLQLKKGEIIGIMGENGCGKSTLMQILQKNYANETGKIIINDNLPLECINTKSWRQLIGIVPQNIHIFNGTILENIAFEDAQNNTKKVLDFLRKNELSSFIDNLPQSYLTLVGEEGINLSGGQKQIIAFARALYHQPELLILDEATAAMDRETERFVLSLLQKVKNEMAIIFITHKLHILKTFCDRLYIFQNGTINNYGSHEKLLNTTNLYSLYWQDINGS